jgi:hypothetical protein
MKYKLEDPEFPNDSTANQFYEPAKIESYRRLGFHIVESFCKQVRADWNIRLMAAMAALEAKLVEEEDSEKESAKLKRDALPKAFAGLQTLTKELQSVAQWADDQFPEKPPVWRSGETCPSGTFDYNCDHCGDRQTGIRLTPGMPFPVCANCKGDAKWVVAKR